ncbi:MAG: hypothetical protein M3460_18170 [Actinomycetota bacterium]|nr:hypothetical protein [Actinomycetota bacterium]
MNDPPVLDSTSSVEKIRILFKHVMAFSDGIIEPEQISTLRELCPSLSSWRRLISAIHLDKLSFQLKVGIQRAEAIRLLSNWCQSFIVNRRKTLVMAPPKYTASSRFC